MEYNNQMKSSSAIHKALSPCHLFFMAQPAKEEEGGGRVMGMSLHI